MTQNEIAEIVASNLVKLRKDRGLTQGDIAEKFSYSDKNVSRWERGEVVPDLATLQDLADFYGVTIDYLTHRPTPDNKLLYVKSRDQIEFRNRLIICALWILGVWTIASVACGSILILHKESIYSVWMPFVWAIPGTFGILFLYAWRYKNKAHLLGYRICFCWSLLTSAYLEIGLHIGENQGWNLAFVFIIGIPLTFIAVLRAKFDK